MIQFSCRLIVALITFATVADGLSIIITNKSFSLSLCNVFIVFANRLTLFTLLLFFFRNLNT